MSCARRIVAALVGLTALLGCSDQQLRPTRGYLVVSIDTLRADHLSGYGYARSTSPFLDRLAAGGVLFENAISQYPSTLVSHMTVFTGLYPQEHGVYPPIRSLSPEIATLAEVFQQAGFRTAGFTEGGLMEGRYGFARGFDEFSDLAAGKPTDVETTLDRGRAFLSSLAPGEPFFLFLHTYSVHAPYTAPEPWDSTYWPRPPPQGAPEPTGRNLMRFNRLGTAKMRPWLPFFVSQYDGLISYTDSRLELFFEYLEAEGLRSDLTVIVLSDHGEEFLDHGFLAHTQIYDETLRVPLVITHPAADPGRRVSDLVQLVDVPATLYELAGLRPPHDLSGHSLVPRLVGDSVRRERPAFGEVGASRTLYAREGGRLYQLVVTRHPADEWLGRWVTFDLAPGQDSFTIRSFEKPRRVSYTVDGGPRRRAGITTEWTEIEVGDPRRDRPIRISLVAMDCEAVIAHHRRCFSMQIREPALERVELFDLTADRAAATDLSRSEPELTARLMRRLGKLRFKALAQPTVEPLEEEVRKRLEALGYLD